MRFKASTKFVATDKLFREYILLTRPNLCEWCKQTKPVQVCHILPKGSFIKLRYTEANILLMCAYCHDKWHDNPIAAAGFLEGYKGRDYKNSLYIQNKMIPHKPDLRLMRFWLRQAVKKHAQ